jgi:hypothetical protein
MSSGVRLAGLLLAVGLAIIPSTGSAASIIKDPNPPKYKLEIEPHLNVQYFYRDTYGAHGFGPGIRFSIPIMSPGFIKTINDSIAISFGGDLLRLSYYENKSCDRNGCYDGPGFWAFYAPVALQWNFWLTDKISVFGEPGLVLRTPFGDYDRKYSGRGADPFVWWAFYGGARFHFSDSIALTLRAGYPTGISVGISIF